MDVPCCLRRAREQGRSPAYATSDAHAACAALARLPGQPPATMAARRGPQRRSPTVELPQVAAHRLRHRAMSRRVTVLRQPTADPRRRARPGQAGPPSAGRRRPRLVRPAGRARRRPGRRPPPGTAREVASPRRRRPARPAVRTSSGQDTGRRPSPTGTTTPTSERTIEWQKASATTVPDHGPVRARGSSRSSSRVRTVVAPSRRLQNAAKSCSPSSAWLASCMAATSSGTAVHDRVVPAQRVERLEPVAQPVAVAPPRGREAGVEPLRGRGHAVHHEVGGQHPAQPVQRRLLRVRGRSDRPAARTPAGPRRRARPLPSRARRRRCARPP